MGKSKHDQIANRIAKKKGTVYIKDQGPDVLTRTQAIEVATSESDLKDSMRQLQSVDRSRYLATSSDLFEEAPDVTKWIGVGVIWGLPGREKNEYPVHS